MTEPGAGHSQEDHTILLFLAYFGILALIPFLIFGHRRGEPQHDFVYRHARQGLALAIAVMVFSVLVWAGDVLLAFIPKYGVLLQRLAWLVLITLAALATITGWVKAFKGRDWVLPGIGRLAEKWL